MTSDTTAVFFAFFNEVGIIEQLGRALLEARLPDGMIAPHFVVLNHLTRVHDGRTPLELARAFQQPKTSMTHTLAGLERMGLVEMRPNPDDKRSKKVWLTDKGRAARTQTIAAMTPEFADLARDFPVDRLAQMLPAMIDLRKIMDQRRDENGAT
jgi:DNA-binding MarR family transcriptional regulator